MACVLIVIVIVSICKASQLPPLQAHPAGQGGLRRSGLAHEQRELCQVRRI